MHGHWLKGYLREGKEIEGGGGSGDSGVMVVHVTRPGNVADKTFGEIRAAMAEGRAVILPWPDEADPDAMTVAYAASFYSEAGGYHVEFISAQPKTIYSINEDAALTDYPVLDVGR